MTKKEQEQGPPVPTLTNQAAFEPPPLRPIKAPPDELAEDIIAAPLGQPDFATNIQPYLVNQSLAPRWIFTDRRRYAQAKAQGWRNCSKHDLKPSFATLSPFEEEGGTKYINGDLILMVIDRKRYLGALRRKHEQAQRLAKPAVQKALSVRSANQDLGEVVNAINRQRATMGQPPVMEAFNPYADEADLDMDVVRAAGRLGHEGGPEFVKKEG